MNPEVNHVDTDRWEGFREVARMAGPIVLGALSFTIMQFVDQIMVARLGADALAAVGSSGLWAYTLSALILGIVACVSTFASQSYGRGDLPSASRFAWQGIYLSLGAVLISLILWPLSTPLFTSMQHTAEVTRLELIYFKLRLIGYVFFAWQATLSSFFQAIGRPSIPMYIAIVANIMNVVLDYGLIFGHFGLPAWGIGGAAIATVLSMAVQCALLQYVFMSKSLDREYKTRSTFAFDPTRIRDLFRIGWPSGMASLLDVANWAIFTSYIVGRLGTVQLAGQTAAINFMQLSFIPVIGLSFATTALVGQWIGRGNIPIAKARAITAMKMGAVSMLLSGTIMALAGGPLIRVFFSADPEVVSVGRNLLILAAIFAAFDAIGIVAMGALRGAGDTRWVMVMTFFATYFFSLPLAFFLAWPMGWGAEGAWIGATIYIIFLSFMLYWRFNSGKWRHIRIFSEDRVEQEN